MWDGLDFLGKMNRLWRMDLLYLTRQQLRRNDAYRETIPEQWLLQRYLQYRFMTLENEMLGKFPIKILKKSFIKNQTRIFDPGCMKNNDCSDL